MQDHIRHLNSSEAYGVFLSHGATPPFSSIDRWIFHDIKRAWEYSP